VASSLTTPRKRAKQNLVGRRPEMKYRFASGYFGKFTQLHVTA
jgi:hypothetical protein